MHCAAALRMQRVSLPPRSALCWSHRTALGVVFPDRINGSWGELLCVAEKQAVVLNQQINQRVVFKLNLSLLGKEIKLYIFIVAYNPYRVNCVVDKEGMAAVTMMDFPLWHIQAASANQHQDGSPGSGEKRLHFPRVAVGCLCLAPDTPEGKGGVGAGVAAGSVSLPRWEDCPWPCWQQAGGLCVEVGAAAGDKGGSLGAQQQDRGS